MVPHLRRGTGFLPRERVGLFVRSGRAPEFKSLTVRQISVAPSELDYAVNPGEKGLVRSPG